jgi:hypothetical protein
MTLHGERLVVGGRCLSPGDLGVSGSAHGCGVRINMQEVVDEAKNE